VDAVEALSDWNQALADTLLPVGASAGHGVLLACDDQAIQSASRRLDIPAEQAAQTFITTLRAAHQITTNRGLQHAAAQIRPHTRVGADAGTPPYLAALCATVLAASRMNRDEKHSTRAYYARLCALLGVEPLDGWPAVAGFRLLVDDGFPALERWLRVSEDGRRGVLLLAENPQPSLIGKPIYQTVLRGRDRDLLTAFFAAHEPQLRAGYDPVLLVRRWGGRERLTLPAQELLDEPELRDALTAAISGAFSAWDGSLLDEGGRRVWPGRLSMIAQPDRVALLLSVPALDRDSQARAPDGSEIALRGHPHVSPLPVVLLAEAAGGPVRLRLSGAESVNAIPGPTVLFEIAAGGLEQVQAIGEQPVWVLTCEPDIMRTIDAAARRFPAPLPAGWVLLADVDPAELPDRLRLTAPDEPVRGAQLTGGLALSAGAWLLDHPPHVICDLPEPAPVRIDGHDHGYLEPGEQLRLSELAGRAGPHGVEIGDLFELDFELRATGTRAGIGTLAHHPTDPVLLRAGAIDAAKHAVSGEQPSVRGALIRSDDSRPWQPPLMTQVNATVHVIYRDGTVEPWAPAEAPAWLRQVGLRHATNRWEIPRGHDAVWLCIVSDPHKRVQAVAAVDVPATDAVLDLVDWFSDAPVIDSADSGAEQRWAPLVALARERESAVAE
jgi:hypothetical protein